LDKIAELDPDNELLQDTGSEDVIDEDRKVSLPIPMHSFEKVYCNDQKGDQLSPFLKKPGNKVGSYKLDGAALLLEYKDNKLVQAYTKGRAGIGQKSLYIAKHIPNIPLTLKNSPFTQFYVKVELIIRNSVFIQKYAQTYANSRNLVAAQLNKKEVDTILNDIEPIAHTLETLENRAYINKITQWDTLHNLGFKVVPHFDIDENITPKDLEQKLLNFKSNDDMLCDGIIIEFVDTAIRTKLGYMPNTNPYFGVAYKVQTDTATSIVTDIEWNVSKQGFLIPRITYNPVVLNGTTCTHATGKNAKFIQDKGVSINSVITLHKGGDIIPDIIDIKPATASVLLPTTCPNCGSNVVWNDTKVNLVCQNKNCSAQFLQKAVHFLKTIGVENISDITVEKIIDEKKFTKIEDFFNLHEEELIMEGIGKITSKKIVNSIKQKLQNIDLAKLMYATNFFDGSVGSKKIQLIIDEYGDLLNINFELTADMISTNIKGFEEKTAKSFIEGFKKFKHWYQINKKFITYTVYQKPKNGKLIGQVFCFTGFRDPDLEKQIIDNGGIVSSSMSKKVTTLIVDDINSTSEKIKKAKSLNIKIIERRSYDALN
jgi:DNA ligase (NAD+)